MFDLISIGGISIDFYFKGDDLTYKDGRFQLAVGGKYVSDFFYEGVGGGAANVAIGVSKFGLSTAILGTIGNNVFKNIILKKLDQYNISYKLCDLVDNYYNVSAILLYQTGERSIIHHVTPNQKLFDHHILINQLDHTKILYLGNLPDISLLEKEKALVFVKKTGITTIVNLGVYDCCRPINELKKILEKTDVLILNGHEFAELVKAQYQDIDFTEDVIGHYIPLLKSKIVIVTEGKKGSYGYYHSQQYHQKAIAVDKISDTTGAGDGYTAAFIAKFYQSQNIEQSMKEGAKYASIILKKVGAN